ncbi:MAG: DUF4019 domain-containing protein [Usitatibacter sp.]
MRMLRCLTLFLTMSLCLGAHAADEELDVRHAMSAAEAWLFTVDSARYGASWEEGAPILQGAVDKARWEIMLEGVRGPLGVANSRKLRSATFARVLPNAPPGEYFVIQFDTQFEKRPLSTEIVTPARGTDGTWRVAGYIIR